MTIYQCRPVSEFTNKQPCLADLYWRYMNSFCQTFLLAVRFGEDKTQSLLNVIISQKWVVIIVEGLMWFSWGVVFTAPLWWLVWLAPWYFLVCQNMFCCLWALLVKRHVDENQLVCVMTFQHLKWAWVWKKLMFLWNFVYFCRAFSWEVS